MSHAPDSESDFPVEDINGAVIVDSGIPLSGVYSNGQFQGRPTNGEVHAAGAVSRVQARYRGAISQASITSLLTASRLSTSLWSVRIPYCLLTETSCEQFTLLFNQQHPPPPKFLSCIMLASDDGDWVVNVFGCSEDLTFRSPVPHTARSLLLFLEDAGMQRPNKINAIHASDVGAPTMVHDDHESL